MWAINLGDKAAVVNRQSLKAYLSGVPMISSCLRVGMQRRGNSFGPIDLICSDSDRILLRGYHVYVGGGELPTNFVDIEDYMRTIEGPNFVFKLTSVQFKLSAIVNTLDMLGIHHGD